MTSLFHGDCGRRRLGLADGLAVTDDMGCWCTLSDPFRRRDRCHRLVPRHARLCNSGRDHGACWYMDAGVPSSAYSLWERKSPLSVMSRATAVCAFNPLCGAELQDRAAPFVT